MARIASILSRQIVGIFVVVYAVAFWRSASQLPPGPAVTYPRLIIGVLLTFVAVEFVAGGWRAAHDNDPAARDGGPAPRTVREQATTLWSTHRKEIVTILLTGLYVFVIEPLGFFIATALYLAVMLPFLGLRRPVPLLALWAGVLLGAWVIFDFLLAVRLPDGLLG